MGKENWKIDISMLERDLEVQVKGSIFIVWLVVMTRQESLGTSREYSFSFRCILSYKFHPLK